MASHSRGAEAVRLRRSGAGGLLLGWNARGLLILIVLTAVLGLALPPQLVIPSLSSFTEIRSPTASLLALLAAVGVLATAQEPMGTIPRTAARRLGVWRAGRLLAALILAWTALILPAPGDPQNALSAASTCAALVGEGLLLARLATNGAAWTAPALHVMAATLLGHRSNGEPLPWAWVIDGEPGPAALLASTALLGAGLWLWARHPT